MKALSQSSGMPQISAAFSGWLSPIVLMKITQVIDNGFPIDVSEEIRFKGVVQPLSPKQLMLKPEGQRAFEWLLICCPAAQRVNLNVNDRIVYNGQKYKVMGQNNYSQSGFIEYHAVQDYQNG